MLRFRAINGLGVLSAMVWLVPTAGFAQNTGIAGVIRDASGAVMPGVTVEASSPALIEKVRTVVTDSQGLYSIVDLRPGTYTVTFTLSGFNALKREGIELTTGFTATVNAELRVGSIAETVTVSGASPVVDTRNVGNQNVVTRAVIDALPTGKLYANLASLVPGVSTRTGQSGPGDSAGSAGNDGQMMMIHGSYQQDQLIRVDGMPMSMMDGSGAPVLGTPSDGMTEETVISLGANTAEVETGGVYVNIIPRTGANRFSGGLSASFASDALQWSNATDAQRRQGQGTSGVKLLSDVNPTFGGPILRDRL